LRNHHIQIAIQKNYEHIKTSGIQLIDQAKNLWCRRGDKIHTEGIENLSSWVPVAHTCNTSYSGGRDQEDHSLKPTQANSL
jgi:hypothetical protein